MEIHELLKFSAQEVRNNPALFSEFERMYVENGGVLGTCRGCGFANAFENLKNNYKRSLVTTENYNKSTMKTFELINTAERYRINENTIFSNTSTDEEAIAFLQQKEYMSLPVSREEREKLFRILPIGYNTNYKHTENQTHKKQSIKNKDTEQE